MNEPELILCNLLNCNRAELYLRRSNRSRLTRSEQLLFSSILEKRKTGLPLQYILGNTEFFGLEFKLCPGVFIPRPETEILVEKAIGMLNAKRYGTAACPKGTLNAINILDIGTGSGNIAISLAKHIPDAKIMAVDISDKAIEVARENAKLHDVTDRIDFIKTDIFSNTQYTMVCSAAKPIVRQPTQREHHSAAACPKGTQYDLVISNPPYIRRADLEHLSREVRHEPRTALDGGEDGLDFYRRILSMASFRLNLSGILLFEIGFGQVEDVKNIIDKHSYFKVSEIWKDYSGIERVIILTKRKAPINLK